MRAGFSTLLGVSDEKNDRGGKGRARSAGWVQTTERGIILVGGRGTSKDRNTTHLFFHYYLYVCTAIMQCFLLPWCHFHAPHSRTHADFFFVFVLAPYNAHTKQFYIFFTKQVVIRNRSQIFFFLCSVFVAFSWAIL